MNTNSTIIFIASLFTTFLVVGVNAWGFYMVHTLESRSMALDEEMRVEEDRGFRHTRSSTIIDSLEERRKGIERYIVSENTIVSHLALIEDTGRRTGISVSVLSVQENADQSAVEISLLLEGSFEGVLKTIRAYETLPVILSVVRGGISTIPSQDDKSPTWSASLMYKLPAHSL